MCTSLYVHVFYICIHKSWVPTFYIMLRMRIHFCICFIFAVLFLRSFSTIENIKIIEWDSSYVFSYILWFVRIMNMSMNTTYIHHHTKHKAKIGTWLRQYNWQTQSFFSSVKLQFSDKNLGLKQIKTTQKKMGRLRHQNRSRNNNQQKSTMRHSIGQLIRYTPDPLITQSVGCNPYPVHCVYTHSSNSLCYTFCVRFSFCCILYCGISIH